MQPTAANLQLPVPVSATPADSPVNLQKTTVFTANAALEPGLLFASLLRRHADEPSPSIPLAADPAAVLPAVAPVAADASLPLPGNVLPPQAHPVPAAADTQPATAAVPSGPVTEPVLPALPAPAQTPVAAAAAFAGRRPAAAAAAAPAVPANSALTEPQAEAAIRTVTFNANTGEAGIVNDTAPAAAVAAVKPDPPETAPRPDIRPVPERQPPLPLPANSFPELTPANPATPQPVSPPATLRPSFTLSHPVVDARWGEALGQRVIWMTEHGMGRAEIRLNPPELGPLQVSVSVSNDEARVAFSVQHGTTRELVEAALPRLREMFASQGIDLTDADVSQYSPGKHGQAGGAGGSSRSSEQDYAGAADAVDDAAAIATAATVREGLIDTYV